MRASEDSKGVGNDLHRWCYTRRTTKDVEGKTI